MSGKIVRLRQAKIVRNATGRTKGRRRNDAYRVREHLTEAEMDKLLAALKRNRHGHRDWLIGLTIIAMTCGSPTLAICAGMTSTCHEERLLICRLYLGLLRTINDDYGAEFATNSASVGRQRLSDRMTWLRRSEGLLSRDQNPERLSAPIGRSERRLVLVHLLHATVTFHLHAALACRSAGRGGSYGRDGVFNVDRPGVLEFEHGVHHLALLQWVLEVHQHDVETGRLEHDRFARLDFKAALHGPHLHHAVFHGHGVNLTLRAGVAGHTADSIRCLAIVRDRHVGSA